jgi:hypothetical protein
MFGPERGFAQQAARRLGWAVSALGLDAGSRRGEPAPGSARELGAAELMQGRHPRRSRLHDAVRARQLVQGDHSLDRTSRSSGQWRVPGHLLRRQSAQATGHGQYGRRESVPMFLVVSHGVRGSSGVRRPQGVAASQRHQHQGQRLAERQAVGRHGRHRRLVPHLRARRHRSALAGEERARDRGLRPH